MADVDQLTKLNEDTFLAESKSEVDGLPWDRYLWRVLADDFRIKRANPAILPQDKHRMIAHVGYDDKAAKRQVSEVNVHQDGDYGVVTSVVTLQGQTDRFHNLKVFTRQPTGDWQCVYWRVTRLTQA